MKTALTAWDGRISPVFDVSREVLVLTIEDGKLLARRSDSIETTTPLAKVHRLSDLGIDTLVCGAISEPLRQTLIAHGIHVLGFVAGEIEEVVSALLSGTLADSNLLMPGCRRHRPNRQRSRHRGAGRGAGG